MNRSWIVVVALPLLVALVAHSPWLALAPSVGLGVLLLALGSGRRFVRLRLHLEQLRWPAIVAITAPIALDTALAQAVAHTVGVAPRSVNGPAGQVVLVLALTSLHSTSVASEFSSGTALTWLAQPRGVRALVAERWFAALVVSVVAVATLIAFEPEVVEGDVFGAACAAALGGVALAAALLLKDPFAALVVSLLATGVQLAALSWFNDHLAPISPAVAMVPLSVGALLGVFARPRALIWKSAPALRPRVGASVGRTTPLVALLRKELRLHELPGVAALAAALGWLLVTGPDAPMVAGFGGVVVGLLAGIATISEERHHGTTWNDVAVLPTRLVWRVKLGVTAAVTGLGGIVLPVALGALKSRVIPSLADQLSALLDYGLLVSLAMVLGLVCATVTKDLTRAFAGALGLALVGAIVWSLGFRLAARPFATVVEGRSLATLASSVVPALMLLVLGVALGRRAWLFGGLTRRASLEGGAIFLSAGVVGGLVQGLGQVLLG